MVIQLSGEIKVYIGRLFNFFDSKRKIEVLRDFNWYETLTGWVDSHAMKHISFKDLHRLSLEDINHIVRNELTDAEVKERDIRRAETARYRVLLEEQEIVNGLIKEPYM